MAERLSPKQEVGGSIPPVPAKPSLMPHQHCDCFWLDDLKCCNCGVAVLYLWANEGCCED